MKPSEKQQFPKRVVEWTAPVVEAFSEGFTARFDDFLIEMDGRDSFASHLYEQASLEHLTFSLGFK